ncbi:MAG: DNA repair protein RecN [Porticoccaceae bacterium]
MLTSLNVTDYGLAEQLEVEFTTGMTAITGETGAGKSLVVDALGMALGDRGDIDRIRTGAERCEVAARFEVAGNAAIQDWLQSQDYPAEPECLLRRIFTRDGRSRGYINGQTATMQQLQALGELLIDIHSQHEHQSLLRRDTHGALLDNQGDHGALLAAVAEPCRAWRELNTRLHQRESDREGLAARRELLAFQVAELDRLAPVAGELAALEREQKLLANAGQVLDDCRALLALGGGDSDDGGGDVRATLYRARQLALSLVAAGAEVASCAELFDSARIQVDEALREIEVFATGVEVDPARLQAVDERLDGYYRLARKHGAEPGALSELHRRLAAELAELSGDGEDLAALRATRARHEKAYRSAAAALSQAREKTAASFSAAVNAQLAALGMASARLSVAIQARRDDDPHPLGAETLEFLISTNPGQPPRPLAKVASGGELSRISLAIQVVAAARTRIPVLVFDEVDVGIGGATAAVVGQLLRRLGERGQVIAITHLPQVASCAHHHLAVSKIASGERTLTHLQMLVAAARVDEIARMLGGTRITRKTVAHARDLLAQAALE